MFDQDSDLQLRAAAGLLLKNSVHSLSFESSPDLVQNYLKGEILNGLVDPINLIRNITGTVITTLFTRYGVEGWPEVLVQLMNLIENSNSQHTSEGALSSIEKICEDSAYKLDQEYNGERPLEYMIPKFLSFTTSENSKVRALSLSCLNQFIPLKSQCLFVHLDSFLSQLFSLASDSDEEVRTSVCTAFAQLLDVRPDKILPHLDGVISYALHTVNDKSEELGLEACKILLGLGESKIPKETIQPHLAKIIPILLDNMRYSEIEIITMKDAEEDDADQEDNIEDIRPTNAKAKDAHSSRQNGQFDNSGSRENAKDEDDDDSDDDEDDDDYDDDLVQWNLRKCSAASLDVFASLLPTSVLNISLTHLKDKFSDSEWPVREAAILAFGAIAEGCIDLATPQLPSLIPYLVNSLDDNEAAVRQIACWTISRYAQWICNQVFYNGDHSNYFLPVLQALMKCGLDKNKKVQESACSSLAGLIEISGELLVPYINPLLQHFVICFGKYKTKNLIILYDAVQTFVEKMGKRLTEKEEYVSLLLPPLIAKWGQLRDSDRDLWPLLECLSSVAAALGEAFAPYAVPVYQRALTILATCISQDQQCETDPNIEPPEKDFIITTVDLIDGLVQGLGSLSGELIRSVEADLGIPIPITIADKSSGSTLMELLLFCFQDTVEEVRQSAYALLGDLTIFVFQPILAPYTEQILYAITNEPDMVSSNPSPVCNNTIWALGELSLQLGSSIEPYLSSIIPVVIPILKSGGQETVLENAAITIGRIGISCPEALAPHLGEFVENWCIRMRSIEENNEKDTAFKGMCNMIMVNPQAMTANNTKFSILALFVDCIGRYEQPSPELKGMFGKVLFGFKEFTGSHWGNNVLQVLDPMVSNELHTQYGI